MSIRGAAAIIGIGEIPTRREIPGRTDIGLLAEVSKLALDDAQLRKEDINGLVTAEGSRDGLAEYIGIYPPFAVGVAMAGASGATTIQVAAAAIVAGYCDTVLCAISGTRGGGGGASVASEFEEPFGRAVAANNGYALVYQRHMYEFGTRPEQLAKLAANQRFNALENPNAAFRGQPITVEDVLNSRYINEPLHLLECVMPCDGAEACIVTSAEKAKAMPHRPVYVLGAGVTQMENAIWMRPRIATSPASISAANAYKMAGYKPADMQFAQFYD